MLLNFQQAALWLYGLQRFGVKLGLEKVTGLLEELGNPHRSFVSTHIAGTNGKGTAAAAADSVLRGHGLRTGLFTSPHLVNLTERVRVDGARVPEEFVSTWVERWRDYVESRRVTFFEVVTALAFDWFRQSNTLAAVVEVGMGGRFDATNVVTPAVGLVTSIGLEHTRYLGDTIAKIAAEKGGIAKTGVPLISGENRAEALEAIRREASLAGADLLLLDDIVRYEVLEIGPQGSRFIYRSPGLELEEVAAPLVGAQAVRNLCLGIAGAEHTLRALGITPDPVKTRDSLARLNWPGRFHRVTSPGGAELVLDVAHNPPAAAKLRENLELVYPGMRPTFIVALAGDKDFSHFLEHLLPLAHGFIFPEVDFGRADTGSGAAQPEKLAAEAAKLSGSAKNIVACGPMAEALELARGADSPVVVTGSFHTVGAALVELGIEP